MGRRLCASVAAVIQLLCTSRGTYQPWNTGLPLALRYALQKGVVTNHYDRSQTDGKHPPGPKAKAEGH